MRNYKLLKRQVQLVYHNEDGSAKSFMQIFINGDKGTVYSLLGAKAFSSIATDLKHIFEDLNINRIDATILKAHYEMFLVKKMGFIEIEKGDDLVMDNQDMTWITVRIGK
tara:strand:- start:148 stop:477 length:330 start_codon:yes stop_codon:yes gene_type:complete